MKTTNNRLDTFIKMILATIAILGVMFIASALNAEDLEKSEKTTITGTVIELDQDLEGNITSAVIVTDTEGDFVIVKDANGDELMKMIDKTVEVTGAVRESGDGMEITVHSYKVIETE